MKVPEPSTPLRVGGPHPVAVAWVTDQPKLTLGIEYECRFTASLVKMSNLEQWLVAQAHLSMGVSNGDLIL